MGGIELPGTLTEMTMGWTVRMAADREHRASPPAPVGASTLGLGRLSLPADDTRPGTAGSPAAIRAGSPTRRSMIGGSGDEKPVHPSADCHDRGRAVGGLQLGGVDP